MYASLEVAEEDRTYFFKHMGADVTIVKQECINHNQQAHVPRACHSVVALKAPACSRRQSWRKV